MFQIKVVEKNPNTFHNQKIFSEKLASYEIMWENVTEPDRPQLTI
jgi:hypothetical protein